MNICGIDGGIAPIAPGPLSIHKKLLRNTLDDSLNCQEKVVTKRHKQKRHPPIILIITSPEILGKRPISATLYKSS
jgi:hypothetical protein